MENQAHLPIVADEHIDIEFGTGVLKVTPAHDKADFDIGQRHGLEVIDVLEADGSMNNLAGTDLAGKDRFKARKEAADKLDELGALLKVEDYKNNVGFSERADVPVEPRLSEQWFLKYPSQSIARACVAEGHDEVPFPCGGQRPTTTGWAGCRIGASAASYGGGIVFRFGIGARRFTAGSILPRATAGNRIPTCSTPGAVRGCGRLPLWAGRRRPRRSRNFIPPPTSSPGRTSFSSGSPA